jgi:hypothetical protein
LNVAALAALSNTVIFTVTARLLPIPWSSLNMLSSSEARSLEAVTSEAAMPDLPPPAAAPDALSDRIDSLRREDETLYNILAVDVWALAKTMDEFQPGFWSEFMKNRERALRRFMSEVVVKSKPEDLRRPPFLQ